MAKIPFPGQPDKTEQVLRALGCAFEREPGGGWVVLGDLDLSRRSLTLLPDLSTVTVKGNFSCANNRLNSLVGAPRAVGGNFFCDLNPLISLEHAPGTVGGDFSCGFCGLVTLKGAPRSVGGDFACQSNQLTSLKHAPENVGKGFFCWSNQLSSLEGAPRAVPGDFLCYLNRLVMLDAAPETVGGVFACWGNRLVTLDEAPKSFRKLWSDLGTFTSWNDVPDALAPGTKARLAREETELADAKARLRALPRPTLKKPGFKP